MTQRGSSESHTEGLPLLKSPTLLSILLPKKKNNPEGI